MDHARANMASIIKEEFGERRKEINQNTLSVINIGIFINHCFYFLLILL